MNSFHSRFTLRLPRLAWLCMAHAAFIFFGPFFGPSLAHAQADGVGSFLDSLVNESKMPPSVRVEPFAPNTIFLASTHQSSGSSESAFELPGSVSLNGAQIEFKTPVFTVHDDKTEYIVHFNEWTPYEAAANEILSRLGFASRRLRQVHGLKIYLGDHKFIELARFWLKSPLKMSWSDTFSELQQDDKGSFIIARQALLEKHIDLYGSWTWDQVETERLGALLLGSIWLQCEDLQQESDLKVIHDSHQERHFLIANLRLCLGHALNASSPNQFAESMFPPPSRDGDRVRLTMRRLARDEGYQRAFVKLKQADFKSFLERSAAFNQISLETVFTAQGFPPALAKLYALKLLHRRNNLLNALGLTTVEPLAPTTTIDDPPHIVKGQVVQNYAGFATELMRSTFEALVQDVGRTALSGLETSAQQLLAHLPYMSGPGVQVGATHVGPGFLLRINRSVNSNPQAKGLDDLYVVRDELELAITLGIGADKGIKFANAWANLGLGLVRRYARVTFASTREKARATYWSLPVELVLQHDFTVLHPGEALLVERGFIGAFGAGGNIKTGYALRPSAYLMASKDILEVFQVYRPDERSYTVISGGESRAILQTAAFWRMYTKFLRWPIASYARTSGQQDLKTYDIPMPLTSETGVSASDMTLASALQRALANGTPNGLDTLIQPATIKTSYDQSRSHYALGWLFGSSFVSSADLLQTTEDAGQGPRSANESRFFVAKRSWMKKLIGTSTISTKDCEAGGVLMYADPNKSSVADGGIVLTCRIEAQANSEDETKEFSALIEKFAETADLPARQARGLIDSQSPIKANESHEALISITIPWSSLKTVLLASSDEWRAGLAPQPIPRRNVDLRRWSPPADPQDVERVAFAMSLRKILSQTTIESRLEELVQTLADQTIDRNFTKDFLSHTPRRFVKIEAHRSSIHLSDSNERALTAGNIEPSPALDYFRRRESPGGKLLLDAF